MYKRQKYNCALKRLDFQQEEGLMSSLPIGVNQVEIERGLTTSSTAVFVPFTTQELFQDGEALYYGLNALSNNMIMVDRKQLKNPNGLILGTPGSGKSFSAKREMTNAFLITEDDIIVCDPEAEYFPLVQKLGGQVIRISPVSTDYINPLDINTNYSEEENPLTLKSDFILSMCELIVGGKDGLQPVEKTIIDRSVRMVYQEFLADPKPEKMPILEDLYNICLLYTSTTRQCAVKTSRHFRSVSLPLRTALCFSGSRSRDSVKHSKCLSLIHISFQMRVVNEAIQT